MSEETNNNQEEQVQEQSSETSSAEAEPQEEERSEEIIPIEWDVVRETFEIRQEQLKIQDYVSKFLLEMERQKADLLARMSMIENRVYEAAADLRGQMNIDSTVPYELKLPDSPEEKAYFIRKQ
jgi:hypothetical protein